MSAIQFGVPVSGFGCVQRRLVETVSTPWRRRGAMHFLGGVRKVLRGSRRRRAVGSARTQDRKYKTLTIRLFLYFRSCVLARRPQSGQRRRRLSATPCWNFVFVSSS